MNKYLIIQLFVVVSSLTSYAIPSYRLEFWMGDLKNELKDRPLTDIVIPATHDSASYGIKVGDNALAIVPGGEITEWANLALPTVVAWAVTQHLPIAEQLKAGARLFDVRVAWREQKKLLGVFHNTTKDGLGVEQAEGVQGILGSQTHYFKNFYTHHGAWSIKLEDFLTPIRDFIAQHPDEVVILKFGGFINMSDARHKELKALIQRIFGAELFNNDNLFLPAVPLDMLVAKKQRVVVAYHGHNPAPFLETDKYFCEGTWANKQSYATLLAFIKERVPNRLSGTKPCTYKLWNTPTEITPDNDMIVKSLNVFQGNRFKSLEDADKSINKNEILQFFKHNKVNPNIVSTDFFNADLARQIIDLNLMKLVKP